MDSFLNVKIFHVLCTLLLVTCVNGQCTDTFCQNNGTCDGDPGSEVCYCPDGFLGPRCEDVDNCFMNAVECFNGGTCHPMDGTCDCPAEFAGMNCEFLDPCKPNPCSNGGTCAVTVGDNYVCECTSQHTGTNCNFLSDPVCESTTCSEGTCLHEDGVYCECYPFYEGARCDQFASCDPNPCLHGGDCIDTGTQQVNVCSCTNDWTGDICEIPTSCDLNPCLNSGTCSDREPVGNKCSCKPRWKGPTCEEEVEPCVETAECQNGGNCTQFQSGFMKCECTTDFTGDFCEEFTGEACGTSPCFNGGTCALVNGGEFCQCLDGYTGTFCESNLVDPCQPNPCSNEDMCSPSLDPPGYICDPPMPPASSGGLSTTTIGIIAGVVVGVLIVVIIVVSVCCFCYRRRNNSSGDKQNFALEAGVKQPRRGSHQYIPSPAQKLMPAVPNLRISSMRDANKMEFPRNRLTILTKLGSGSFADVYKAEAVGIVKDNMKSVVAVKMLKDTATENDKSDLSKELSLYMFLDPHPNITNILGCCTEQDPWYIIMEYLPHGNLQGYLRQVRTGKLPSDPYKNVHGNIPPNDLLTFSVQIARGMEYLSSKQCIHRDLAARNILLGEGLVCKVSDFGLARDLEDGQTYEMKSQGRVPVRWMAPESLLQNTYNSQSDVWSFGILMWEIVTLGSHPYPGLASRQVIKEIAAGTRLPKPDHCSQEIYDLMTECWREDPVERPTFAQIRQTLENMLADSQGYLVMSNFNDDNYLYLEPDQQTGDSLDDGDPVLSHL